jgi:GNAT superfamily N-acetyltransferase
VAGVRLARTDIEAEVARALIFKLNAELRARYPHEVSHHVRVDPEEVSPGRGAFLVAYVDEAPVGCGAVRRLKGDEAEIKRMYVVSEMRGRGLGKALVSALEEHARALGIVRLVLETGEMQPEAIGLYASLGFEVIPLFGEYVGSPMSVCMAKSLA